MERKTSTVGGKCAGCLVRGAPSANLDRGGGSLPGRRHNNTAAKGFQQAKMRRWIHVAGYCNFARQGTPKYHAARDVALHTAGHSPQNIKSTQLSIRSSIHSAAYQRRSDDPLQSVHETHPSNNACTSTRTAQQSTGECYSSINIAGSIRFFVEILPSTANLKSI